jgi:pimeloyl-ACP methyl ester carboxylesterase
LGRQVRCRATWAAAAPDGGCGRNHTDAIVGCIGVALKRASLFGRAPVLHDLTVALTIWGYLGDAPPDLVPRLFRERALTGGVLDSMPEPEVLPGWLGELDLDAYARAYARTGFWGPLGVYRNQDRDWHEHPEIGTAGVRQPALFIGGRRDPAVLFGKLEPMEAAVPNLRRIVLLPNCGHWTQQERPGDVNDELLDFLRRQQRS